MRPLHDLCVNISGWNDDVGAVGVHLQFEDTLLKSKVGDHIPYVTDAIE